jgi:peptidoglycan/LPS O-acetylase OafA/YrhL
VYVERTRRELDAITALRFFAALLVFVYHCAPTQPFAARYALGHIGVGFFFLLSGFILTYTYHREFAETAMWPAVRAFYVARIARIYPVHLVATAFAVLVLCRFGGTVWDASSPGTRELAVAGQLLLVQAWVPDEKIYLGINAPAWSISAEMFFYAAFPFLMRSLLRSFRTSLPRVLWIAAASAWAVEVAVALVPHRITVWTGYVLPPVRIADFLVGMLLGIAFLRSMPARPNLARASFVEVLALAAAAGAIAVSPRAPDALRYALLLMPFWAALIGVFAHQAGAVSGILRGPAFVALGRASFAFYLIHWPVIAVVGGTVGWSHPVPAMLLAFAVSIALSFALFHWVEQPLRSRVRSAFAGRTLAVAAAAVNRCDQRAVKAGTSFGVSSAALPFRPGGRART